MATSPKNLDFCVIAGCRAGSVCGRVHGLDGRYQDNCGRPGCRKGSVCGSYLCDQVLDPPLSEPEPDTPLAVQVGGDHYKSCKIQPVEYIEANELGFLEGCIVKRITRHSKPTGKGQQDIEKIIHECQLLLSLRYGAKDDG